MSYISNCCGDEMNDMWQDYEMCPGCHDHCELEFVPDEELIPGAINGLEESKYERVMGLKAPKELVDKYYIKRINKPLDDKVSFKDIKPIKSIV